MQTAFRILFGLCMIPLAACSSNSVRRHTYQSLQIMQQRECQQQPGKDCPPPESYDRYRQQRDEVIGK